MRRFISKVSLLASLCVVSFFTKAAFIVDGTHSVNALSINETFESFYSYSSPVGGSSNTGYEINDSVVLFLVEYANSYALIGLVDGTSTTGDTTDGLMFLTLQDLTGSLNSLLVSDDINDASVQNPSTIKFTFGFGPGKNDGFVYSLGSGSNVDIFLGYQYVRGLSEAVFLSFDDGLVNQISLGSSTTLQGSAPQLNLASAPSASGVLMLGVVLLIGSRLRKVSSIIDFSKN